MTNEEKIDEARKTLTEAGYFTDNLWHIKDVQELFICDEETAQEILYKAITNDASFDQIWFAIREAANKLNLKEKTYE